MGPNKRTGYLPSAQEAVVYLDRRSEKRVLWCGDRFLHEKLPAGTRVIYPTAPISGLCDPDRAIRHALDHPEGGEPLRALLVRGMRVTIALDDISFTLPQMRRPDLRERMLDVIVPMLEDHGVEDIHLVWAICLHRRMTPAEMKATIGARWFKKFWPDRIYNHDAEDPAGLVNLGRSCHGEVVNINRRAVESDLTIYLNINLVPMDGGHKSVGVGLCDYQTLKAHHTPQTIRQSHSYMDPDNSELHRSCKRIGRLVDEKMKVFHVETVVNNRGFGDQMAFLGRSEDRFSGFERTKARLAKEALDRLPARARQEMFYRLRSPYELIAVHAGTTDATHDKILAASFKQYLVPVDGQADILILPVSPYSPYNVGSVLNPLLVQVMALGYLMNLWRGRSLLKPGGTVILCHPCHDVFDPAQHPSYIEFFHRILPETRDAGVIQEVFEERLATDPSYIHMYRTGTAYHGAHACFMWYWGENGRQQAGRVIAAGCEQPYVAERLGWEWATTLAEAIDMAQAGDRTKQITLAQYAPTFIADVR
jgi:hypothetical protein